MKNKIKQFLFCLRFFHCENLNKRVIKTVANEWIVFVVAVFFGVFVEAGFVVLDCDELIVEAVFVVIDCDELIVEAGFVVLDCDELIVGTVFVVLVW